MKLRKSRSNYTPQPVTRLEKIWAAMAGVYSPTPEPVKRIEYWMTKTAERIEGGGGGGGTTYTGQDGIIVDNSTHVIRPDTEVLATKDDIPTDVPEVFYAIYGVTTAQQIIAVVNVPNPTKQIWFKRNNAANPYPVVKIPSMGTDSITLQIFQMQTNSGEHTPQVIEYTVVNSTWSSHSFDMALESELADFNPLMAQGRTTDLIHLTETHYRASHART